MWGPYLQNQDEESIGLWLLRVVVRLREVIPVGPGAGLQGADGLNTEWAGAVSGQRIVAGVCPVACLRDLCGEAGSSGEKGPTDLCARPCGITHKQVSPLPTHFLLCELGGGNVTWICVNSIHWHS